MANGAVQYRFIDAKMGLTSPSRPGAQNVPLWSTLVGKTPAVGDQCQNGGFLLRCSVSGACAASGVGPTPQYLTDGAATWVLTGAAQPGQSGLEPLNQADYVADPNTGLVPRHELGIIVCGKDYGPNDYGEAEFMYVKLTGATDLVAGDFVVINRFSKTGVQSPAGGYAAGKYFEVGIVMANHKLSATTPSYGWVMVRGVHDGAHVLAAAATVDTILTLSATAGAASQGVANGSLDGSALRVAAANGLATVEIYWPVCAGR
jgi:hypothetical protein